MHPVPCLQKRQSIAFVLVYTKWASWRLRCSRQLSSYEQRFVKWLAVLCSIQKITASLLLHTHNPTMCCGWICWLDLNMLFTNIVFQDAFDWLWSYAIVFCVCWAARQLYKLLWWKKTSGWSAWLLGGHLHHPEDIMSVLSSTTAATFNSTRYNWCQVSQTPLPPLPPHYLLRSRRCMTMQPLYDIHIRS